MRRMIVLALAMTATAAAVPAAAFYLSKPGNDTFGEILGEYGFLPIRPPSNLMHVGSLYYVDPAVRDFKAICHAAKADIEIAVMTSPSWNMQQRLQREGRLATGVNVDLGPVLKGDLDDNYVQKVHSSLSDVVLEELPLGANWLIFAKLMERPECNKIAMQYVSSGGYVCQGQKLLQATAEFGIDSDTQRKLTAKAKTTVDDIKTAIKTAMETQSDMTVVERAGRLFAGSALHFGVSMNPTCLAPPHARFQRVLPRTLFGRAWNFVLYRIVEPLLPAKPDQVTIAQN